MMHPTTLIDERSPAMQRHPTDALLIDAATPDRTPRLAPAAYALVRPHHVWEAVRAIVAGARDLAYRDSTDYDLIGSEGVRLPPKVVFAAAASAALGFEVLPGYFRGGEGTPAFRVLREAGFVIVSKTSPAPLAAVVAAAPWEVAWLAADDAALAHLTRERMPALRRAKRSEVAAQGGRWRCEGCGLEPTLLHGPEGEWLLEVHHAANTAADAPLPALAACRVLCANCHRVAHLRSGRR
jgi:hypothetical protein